MARSATITFVRTVLSREGALPGTAPGRQIDSVWWIDGESASPRGGLLDPYEMQRAHEIRDQPRPAGVPGIHLSVSYSGHLAVVAATRGRAIGVDIEDRRRAVPAATRQRIESELGITSGHAPGCDGGFIESWSWQKPC